MELSGAYQTGGVLFDKPTMLKTVTGREVDLANFRPEDVDWCDIVHALSLQGRFACHTPRLYTVAQHSVRVFEAIEDRQSVRDSRWALKVAALLHDAAEAYIGDCTSPLKKIIGEPLAAVEQQIEESIAKAAGISSEWFSHPLLKEIDIQMVRLEYNEMFGENRDEFIPWDYRMAKRTMAWKLNWILR